MNDINSDVQTGGVFGIFGPFGAGKTTTSMMIVALMPNPNLLVRKWVKRLGEI